jgi:hypothetical protein
MTESSLCFNGVGFCPSVSGYRNKPIDLRYLVKPQEGVERRLDDGTDDINVKDKDKHENPHSEV